jgi:acyl-coenzyme A synthetase/AMP-(fatty) acid ligase
VPPAELESVLLQHPDIADSGVIAVDSVEEATELPRYAELLQIESNIADYKHSLRAYVVHAKGLKTDAEKQQFAKEVQRWIETRVAKHKYLRGGEFAIFKYLYLLY